MPSAATWPDGPASPSVGKRFNFIVAVRERIESVLRPRVARSMARAVPDASARRPQVTLIGAGPGAPDLLTIAAARAIAQAEVVLYDHLVGAGILDLARPDAELVCVGKRSGHHSHGQEASTR